MYEYINIEKRTHTRYTVILRDLILNVHEDDATYTNLIIKSRIHKAFIVYLEPWRDNKPETADNGIVQVVRSRVYRRGDENEQVK